MAEYMEREAAIKAIYESDPNGIRRTLGFNVGQIEEALRAVPSVSVPQWISVKDRLPCCGNPVLVGNLSWRWVSIAQYHGVINRWELLSQVNPDIGITHWMPLPEPPKGENDG
nr:MAG TPA: Protein of unknown function (DUF551) [Caudoviricetes sp.]